MSIFGNIWRLAFQSSDPRSSRDLELLVASKIMRKTLIETAGLSQIGSDKLCRHNHGYTALVREDGA